MTSQSKTLRRILGVTILITLTLLLGNSYRKDRIGRVANSYPLYATFSEVQGLKNGDPVSLSGKLIGKITKVSLNPESLTVLVALAIDNTISLPLDSAAIIRGQGFSEQKELLIEPGAEENSMPKGSAFQFTRDPIELLQLIETLVLQAERNTATPSSQP